MPDTSAPGRQPAIAGGVLAGARSALVGGLLLAVVGTACATLPSDEGGTLDAALEADGARVLWVGAHPDDEALAGPILARACRGLGRPCRMLVLTHGDGGECLRWPNCNPSLAAIRGEELREVARRFHADLEHHAYWNAPLPWASFPRREEIAARWIAQGDPTAVVARAIDDFRPTVLLTFDADRGFTGHPEHQLAARFAMEGAAKATWKVPHAYQVLNHFWITRMLGTSDPNAPTEWFDTHVSCGSAGRTCLDVALRISHAHQTQARDMGTVRALRPQMGTFWLRKVDVEEEARLRPALQKEVRD